MEQRESYSPHHTVTDRKGQLDSVQDQHMGNARKVRSQNRGYQAQKRRQQAKRKRIVRGLLTLFLLVLFVIAVVIISKELRRDELEGVWALDQTTVYEFDGKGSGILRLPLGNYAFSYTVEDNCLAIDFADEKATDAVYKYSVDGSMLTLDSENDSVFRLEKQK